MSSSYIVCRLQEKPDAVLPTMGGQTALNLAKSLAEVGLWPGQNDNASVWDILPSVES